jgi:hypothetical protein
MFQLARTAISSLRCLLGVEINPIPDPCQKVVGASFLSYGLIQKLDMRCVSYNLCKAADSAVSYNLIAFDALRCGNQRSVSYGFVESILDHVVTLFHERGHDLALNRFGLSGNLSEDLFDPQDLNFRVLEVRPEHLLELRIGCLLDHLWHCLFNLLLCREKHLQLIDVEPAKTI